MNGLSAANGRAVDATRTVRLTIPAKPEYITLSRLALSGLSRVRPLSDAMLADLKLALTEACSNSVRHAYVDGDGQVHISFELEHDRLVIEVADSGAGFVLDDSAQDEDAELTRVVWGSRSSARSPTRSRSVAVRTGAGRACASSSSSDAGAAAPRLRDGAPSQADSRLEPRPDRVRARRGRQAGRPARRRRPRHGAGPLVSHHDVTWIASAITARTARSPRTGRARRPLADGARYRLRLVAHPQASYDLFYNVVANPVLWFLQHGLWANAAS